VSREYDEEDEHGPGNGVYTYQKPTRSITGLYIRHNIKKAWSGTSTRDLVAVAVNRDDATKDAHSEDSTKDRGKQLFAKGNSDNLLYDSGSDDAYGEEYEEYRDNTGRAEGRWPIVACQAESSSSIFSFTAMKRGRINSGWRTRYFECDCANQSITYYKGSSNDDSFHRSNSSNSSESARGNTRVRGVINVTRAMLVHLQEHTIHPSAASGSSSSNTALVDVQDQTGRVYHLKMGSPAAAQRLVAVFAVRGGSGL
jgi:hypothetical protein